jgi:hypothetical protein
MQKALELEQSRYWGLTAVVDCHRRGSCECFTEAIGAERFCGDMAVCQRVEVCSIARAFALPLFIGPL